MATIKWVVKDDPAKTVHESPNTHTMERAAELCDIANASFDKAYHWVIDVPAPN